MISIRSNFFYTRTVPCELWHFDRSKPAERRDKVHMIDARNIYRKVTRKIYDFTPEQQQNLAAIVWLYRGQSERFIALVQEYLECTLAEAAAIACKTDSFRAAYDALMGAAAPFLKRLLSKPRSSRGNEAQTEKSESGNSQSLLTSAATIAKERDEAAKTCFAALDELTARIAKEWKKPCEPKLAAQKKLLVGLEELATACRDTVKEIDLVFKLAARVVDAAEKDAKPPGELQRTRTTIRTKRPAAHPEEKVAGYKKIASSGDSIDLRQRDEQEICDHNEKTVARAQGEN